MLNPTTPADPTANPATPPARPHGGYRPGAGRKAIYGELMGVMTLRLTQAQAERMTELGGSDWLREVLSADTLPQAVTSGAPADRLKVINVRLTQAQRDRLQSVGGGKWLRQVLDRSIAAAQTNALIADDLPPIV